MISSGSVMTVLQSVVSSLSVVIVRRSAVSSWSVVNCGLVCDEFIYTNFTS